MTASKLDIAVRWLWKHLQKGSKPCGDRFKPTPNTVYGDGIQAGHAGMTIRRAADKLKIQRKKVGKRWYWSLPEGCKPPKPVVVPQPEFPARKRKRRHRRLIITISFE